MRGVTYVSLSIAGSEIVTYPVITVLKDLKGPFLIAMFAAPLLTRLKLSFVAAEPFMQIWPAPITDRDSKDPAEETLHLQQALATRGLQYLGAFSILWLWKTKFRPSLYYHRLHLAVL